MDGDITTHAYPLFCMAMVRLGRPIAPLKIGRADRWVATLARIPLVWVLAGHLSAISLRRAALLSLRANITTEVLVFKTTKLDVLHFYRAVVRETFFSPALTRLGLWLPAIKA